MSIVSSVIEPQKEEACQAPVDLSCEPGGIIASKFDTKIKIEFPRDYQILPMAGGAVISFGTGLKFKPSDSISRILAKGTNSLSGRSFQNNIADLNNARRLISGSLFDIAKRNIKIKNEDSKIRSPFIYFSVFKGEDSSSVKDGLMNSDLIRLVDFRYIPAESFSSALGNILSNNDALSDAVGISGRRFSELKSTADEIRRSISLGTPSPEIDPQRASIVDLALEFFPVINISSRDLLSRRSSPVLGGYYTILDGRIYIKMPDLSGRDLSGDKADIITNDSEIFLEVMINSTLSRLKIDVGEFKMPPSLTLSGEQEEEFSPGKPLVVALESDTNEQMEIYLSPVINNLSPSSQILPRRPIDTYSDNLEIFTVPVLTNPIQSGFMRTPYINEASSPSSSESLVLYNSIPKYFSKQNTGNEFPYIGNINSAIYFGEMNRPEVVMSSSLGRTTERNNRKYFNISSSAAIEILSSVYPKIYDSVPSMWPKALLTESGDLLIAEFSPDNFSGIDISAVSGSIGYAVYARDTVGQVVRVSGPIIRLSAPAPSVVAVTPEGFNDVTAIVLDDRTLISISGDNFDSAVKVILENDSGLIITLPLRRDVGPAIIRSNEEITIDFVIGQMSQIGLSTGGWEIIIEGFNSNLISQIFPISISSPDVSPSPRVPSLVKFRGSEIKPRDFSGPSIYGVPLFKDGRSARLRLKSSTRIFTGKRNVYAYLALSNTEEDLKVMQDFCFPDRIASVSAPSLPTDLLLAMDIEYTFEKSPNGDFGGELLSAKNATINFPGRKYSGYNFSRLEGIGRAYLVFTNRRISELLGQNRTITFEEDESNYDFIEIGDDNNYAFIPPSNVLGLAAEISGSRVSTFPPSDRQGLSGVFSEPIDRVGEISTRGSIPRLAVIVSGIEEKRLDKRYDIRFAGKSIMNKLASKPEMVGRNEILFVFDNVSSRQKGFLDITTFKRERIFGRNYSSEEYTGQITAIIKDSLNLLDDKSFLLDEPIEPEALTSNISDFIERLDFNSGIIGDSDNLIDSLFPVSTRNGLVFKPSAFELEYGTFSPVAIRSTSNITINDGKEDLLISVMETTGINALAKNFLKIPIGTIFPPGRYLHSNSLNSTLLFLNSSIRKLATIKYNVSQVVSINEIGTEPIIISSGRKIELESGKKYEVIVEGGEKEFIIKINDLEVRPSKVDEVSNGVYKAIIEAPDGLNGIIVSENNCLTICASDENSDRLRAGDQLNRSYVAELEKIETGLLIGNLKDKVPDISKITDRLSDNPLRFISVILDKANVPKDLIRSFCDLSFHLLAELKVSLNGFRVLMTPVQVIFCIIDVICSLLNPIKIARAVVRLFQCLYDLILILPQLSIPVMFLQLILHLLELIQCIVDKVLFTVTGINEIIRAINVAGKKPINFAALKSLEERLSEYLFDIDADLQVFEPVASIISIFLQLLQLTFRFPCSVNPGDGQSDCGVDGTMLAGIVAGIVSPENDDIDFSTLLPVAQDYIVSNDGSTRGATEANPGNIAAILGVSGFLDSLSIDEDSLRSTASGSNGVNFNITMAPTFTKSTKPGRKSRQVKFNFNNRAKSTALNEKNIDPNQTIDAPLFFFEQTNNQLVITENGNIFSPIDGKSFLNITGNTASVKSLVVDLNIPIITTDPTTGVPLQSGTEVVSRTFDNIPMMVMMDDNFNVYFVKDNGIKFGSDGSVSEIIAEIANMPSAPKMKFSREEAEIDTNGDGDVDGDDNGDTIKIFDFPQLYFFDMRQASEQLEQFCSTASINSFPFEGNNIEDITDIVDGSQECLSTFVNSIREQVSEVRRSSQIGISSLKEIDIDTLQKNVKTATECFEDAADNICKYAVSSLNSSFKVLGDDDLTPRSDAPPIDIGEEALEGFEESGPAFTGAREFAAGIGDSAEIPLGSEATIEVILRDNFDEFLFGDFSSKIELTIISDQTGSAEIILDSLGNSFNKNGTSYFARVKSNGLGEVRLRAKVCDRTIQAITFAGLNSNLDNSRIDCVDDMLPSGTPAVTPFGALQKIDRIISIFFVGGQQGSAKILTNNDVSSLPVTDPQVFGSSMEN